MDHAAVRAEPPKDQGVATGSPAELRARTLSAWEEFLSLAADLDPRAPSRLPGWRTGDVLAHLGSWPERPTMGRLLAEARAAGGTGPGAAAGGEPPPIDQDGENEAVVRAHGGAPPGDLLDALRTARRAVADALADDGPVFSGGRADAHPGPGLAPTRSALGLLPLLTQIHATSYELAVHALDIAPPEAVGRPLLDAGLAALMDVTGALAARGGIRTGAAAGGPVVSGGGRLGWSFTTRGGGWALEPGVGPGRALPVVEGPVHLLLDASAGRQSVPGLLARRELRLRGLPALLTLAPLVEAVPGLPGGPALHRAVRCLGGAAGLVGGMLGRLAPPRRG